MRVLGQFDVEIDRSNLTSAIKCWHLKEFVDPKGRILIDDLPFTSSQKSFNQVKSVYSAKIASQSAVSWEFVTHVNILDTTWELQNIYECVRFTLDKLGV